MSPTHFLDSATMYEITAFLSGASQRSRDEWEQTRFVMQSVYNSVGAKIKDPKDILTFPWEKEHKDVDPDEEIAKLKSMQEYAKKLNQNKVKNNG